MEENIGEKKTNKIGLIVLIVVLVLGVGCGAFFLGKQFGDKKPTEPSKENENIPQASNEDNPNINPSGNEAETFSATREQEYINSSVQLSFIDLKKALEIEWADTKVSGEKIDNKKITSSLSFYGMDDAIYEIVSLTEDGAVYIYFPEEKPEKVDLNYSVKRIGTLATRDYEIGFGEQYLVLETTNGEQYISVYDSNTDKYHFDRKLSDVFDSSMILSDMPCDYFIEDTITNIGRLYINVKGNVALSKIAFKNGNVIRDNSKPISGLYFVHVSDNKITKYYVITNDKIYVIDNEINDYTYVAKIKSINVKASNNNEVPAYAIRDNYELHSEEYYVLTVTLDNNEQIVFSTQN